MSGATRHALLLVWLCLAAPLCAVAPALGQQIDPDEPVDPQRAATDDVLSQLRDSDAEDVTATPSEPELTPSPAAPPARAPIASPAATPAAAPAATDVEPAPGDPEAVAPPRPNADGVIAEPDLADGRVPTDGVLRDPDEVIARDGALDADGQAVAPRVPVEDQPQPDPRVADTPLAQPLLDALDEEPPEDAEAGNALSGTPTPRPSLRTTDLDDGDPERPYDAIGYKLGAFRLFPSITTDATFDDNVFRTAENAQHDWISTLRPSLALRSQWDVHSLEAEIAAVRSWHRRFDELNDRELTALLRGRLDVTARGRLEGELDYSFAQQEQGGVDSPLLTGTADGNGSASDVITRGGRLAYEQRFNRLVGRIDGEARFTNQGVAAALVTDPAICAVANPPPECATVQQSFADRSIGLRLGYEIAGGIDVFGEVDWNHRAYTDDDTQASRRDSNGRAIRLGAAFDTGPILRGSIALGYAEQTPLDTRLTSLHGAIVEADITWVPSALTTVTLTARNGITTTALDGSIGAWENSSRIDVRHEFRRWLALRAGLGYTRRDYAGIDLNELELQSNIGIDYALDRRWALLAQYTRVVFHSSLENRDYVDNAVRIGLRLQR